MACILLFTFVNIFLHLFNYMIWVLIYFILLFIMVSSALLAGMRRDEANFFADRVNFFAKNNNMDEVELSV